MTVWRVLVPEERLVMRLGISATAKRNVAQKNKRGDMNTKRSA